MSSHSSIEEMQSVEKYQLSSQNHMSASTVKNTHCLSHNVNYFSQNVMPQNQESRGQIDLKKFRTKLNSSKKSQVDPRSSENINSSRVNPHQLFKGVTFKTNQEQTNSVSSTKAAIKSKKYSSVYQEILSRMGIQVEKANKDNSRDKSSSTSCIIKKGTFTYRKKAAEGNSQDSAKGRYKMSKDQGHNISVSKIL